MLKKVNQPILFQGNLKKKNYFEGWYYKQVSEDQKTSLSFIPGISLNKGDEHSFIQYILVQSHGPGKSETLTGYVRYPLRSFHYQNQPFKVTIGESSFSETEVKIDLMDKRFHFNGHFQLGPLYPIERTPLQPNIMGIFGYLPKMECYHGVISMQHTLNGFIRLNEEKLNFNGGIGYMEKDWGTSFPKEYIWIHSNHFQNETASLFFSVAHIPFHIVAFEGFISNFVIEGKEYRFATYNNSKCTILDVADDYVDIRLENKSARLDIHAQVLEQGELIAPVKGTMQKTIKEGIAGIIHIRLEDKITGKVYEDVGKNGGVEIVDYV